MRKWYEIRNQANRHAELWIYEQIGEDWWTGEGVTAKAFCQELAALDVDTIDLHVNSPGGLVSDGQAIYNALKNHPAAVTAYIDGVAASIASVIAMAGDTVVMNENALFMIHDPYGVCRGTEDDMRSMADVLAKFRDTIAGVYEAKTKMDPKKLRKMMKDETWMTAAEAHDMGFCDEVCSNMAAAASIDFDFRALGFKHGPPRPAESSATQEAAGSGLSSAPVVSEPSAPEPAAAGEAPVDELAAKRRERAYKRLSNRERD